MKDIILLGSTGSVGKNVLDVVRHYSDKFRIRAIASNENLDSLLEQAEEFHPDVAVIGNEKYYSDLKDSVPAGVQVFAGGEEVVRLACEVKADIVFIAIGGMAALDPLIAALNNSRTVALASKEPIVSAGAVIQKIQREKKARIIPVDSEHSAVMQCLSGRSTKDVRTLYLTGSGGSLKDKKEEDFGSITLEEVLDHPKWNMGQKITVDSATLMNKGLEAIEARWLFDIPPAAIKVVIHPEAIIHSMVEFLDGTVSASLFCPDMRFPILKALSFPDIMESNFPRVDFTAIKGFSFMEPDTRKFPALELAFDAMRAGGTVPAVLNASNEVAVNMFLENKIRFTDIIKIVSKTIDGHKSIDEPSMDDIKNAEKWAIEEVLRSC